MYCLVLTWTEFPRISKTGYHTTAVMSLLSDLVHLRTIEVSPLQCTTLEFRLRVKPRVHH
ncbi:BQ5605_C029g10681 [Microbotryum silenes-dioicae]|uniref:BQ5605_C029g10681 protein n=1 Tax=Microbotryum silenes-dioicae TaxID=796604 RepID=A0A2X0MN66_9BASI|nr:BQ5605_C029g10681 [Microbotryum silenes-dioicae]